MPTLIQYRLFEEPEVIQLPTIDHDTGDFKQNMFVGKFKRKKTTDDCYTPPAVYDAVVEYVKAHVAWVSDCEIVRPFYTGGDYLHYSYPANCVVIDNPPFSIYSKIVRNYQRMAVKFFLFGPALSLFVRGVEGVQYIICRCNITYENGANVRTGFVTNLFHSGGKIINLSGKLSNAINRAQKKGSKVKDKFAKPYNMFSSADLMRYVPSNSDEMWLSGGVNFGEIHTHIDGRKVFGGAMKFTDAESNFLHDLDHERA